LPGFAFGSDDKTPPELKSLQFTPASIDTSTGTAEVTLTFSVTDDASGATYFEATFVDASGVARQSASVKFAPAMAATNSIKVAFPRFSNSGAWTLAHVFLSDAAGNSLILDADGLTGRGLPTRLEVKSVRDTVSPKLTALEFSPAQIDTSAGPAGVNVNYTATDDLSGVNYIELSFVSPSGAARQNRSARLEAAQSVSKSLTVTFPRLSEPGQWTLSTVFLSDAAGNTLLLDAGALVRAGLKTNLEVKSTLDTTPPNLTALRFAPEAIDTSLGPAVVKADFTATDDLSGVSYLELSFTSPSGKKLGGSARFNPARLESNSIALTFPAQSESGRWALTGLFLSDAAGNTLVLDGEAALRLGLPTVLEVKSTSDMAPPNLTAFRFSPDAIDTSRSAAEVKVEFTATDNLSGVKSIEVVFVSPTGNARQRAAAAFSPAKEVTQSVMAIFPQSSEPGNWKVGSVIVSDAAGNTLVLDGDALAYKVGKSLQVR